MLITGFHAIEEALRNKRKAILFLSAKNSRTLHLEELAQNSKIDTKYISSQEMLKLSGQHSLKAVLKILPCRKSKINLQVKTLKDYLGEWKNKQNLLVLILDGITDVHNFGAILRSAHMFHVDLVITPKHNSAYVNETVYRTSSGACEYVQVLVSNNLRQSLESLKKEGFWIYSAELQGKPLSEIDLTHTRVGIVMGSENKGLRQLTKRMCDVALTIPCQGRIDSLNVSVATGIILYEVRRQELAAK